MGPRGVISSLRTIFLHDKTEIFSSISYNQKALTYRESSICFADRKIHISHYYLPMTDPMEDLIVILHLPYVVSLPGNRWEGFFTKEREKTTADASHIERCTVSSPDPTSSRKNYHQEHNESQATP